MYGCDGEFLTELDAIGSTLIARILDLLKVLRDSNEQKRQASLAAKLLETLLHYGDLESTHLLKLVKNLWLMVEKQHHDPAIVKFLQDLRRFVLIESKSYTPLAILAELFINGENSG